MYALKVKKELTTPDGRLFLPGHDVSGLNAFEISELITEFPNVFEPANDETLEFTKNTENVKHLAGAVKQQRQEMEQFKGITGNLSARKTK